MHLLDYQWRCRREVQRAVISWLRPGRRTTLSGIRRLNMKWIVLGCATLVAGCANSPPGDNRSAPGAGQPAVDKAREARALEQAEANCASQGKHAEAKRVEGATVYDCVER